MKKLLALVMAVGMFFSFVACGGGSIQGKWTFGGCIYEFKEENKLSVSVNGALNYDGTYEIDGDVINVKVKGMMGDVEEELKYTLKGDTLTLEGNVTFTGSDVTMEFAKAK